MPLQTTLRDSVCVRGVGVHTGQTIELHILPAPVGAGITFIRCDVPGSAPIEANVRNIVDTNLATTLGAGCNGSSARVATVEHLMAALWGLGIDNAQIVLDGPEVPVLDGSAKPFAEAILHAGWVEQSRPKRLGVVRRPLEVSDGHRKALLEPLEPEDVQRGITLRIRCEIHFDHPIVSDRPFVIDYTPEAFLQQIAPARTFGFLRDVEALQRRGLCLGGSLENAIVIDDQRVLNPGGLRFHDELIRHKVLDAFGDLALLGVRLVGQLTLIRPGHSLNAQWLGALSGDDTCLQIINGDELWNHSPLRAGASL